MEKIIYYPNDFKFNFENKPSNITIIKLIESDTFSYAQENKDTKFCCLNFASSRNPGGGYKGKCKAQEEDLFRTSNLPELMDNDEVKKFYPLMDSAGLYCPEVIVNKDKDYSSIDPFLTSVITLPALYKPSPTKKNIILTKAKMKRIFEIALENKEYNLILGAWGCGAYHNEPHIIARMFNLFLNNTFNNVFSQVVFAIPDKNSTNYKTFEKEFVDDKSLADLL